MLRIAYERRKLPLELATESLLFAAFVAIKWCKSFDLAPA